MVSYEIDIVVWYCYCKNGFKLLVGIGGILYICFYMYKEFFSFFILNFYEELL